MNTANVRRTLKDIAAWLSAREVYTLITEKPWPYRSTERQRLVTRDRALMAVDFVGCFRNHEVLKRLTAQSFQELDAYWVLTDGYIGKRSAKLVAKYGSRVTTREQILFPKFMHPLLPFTDLIVAYLRLLEDDDTLFPFGERRHHQIVYHCTGMWPHWLRAMGENWYGHNVFPNDPVSLAKYVGVVNVQSIMPYVSLDIESYRERLKGATDHH